MKLALRNLNGTWLLSRSDRPDRAFVVDASARDAQLLAFLGVVERDDHNMPVLVEQEIDLGQASQPVEPAVAWDAWPGLDGCAADCACKAVTPCA